MKASILEADRRRAGVHVAFRQAARDIEAALATEDEELLAQAYANHRTAFKALQDFRARECDIYAAEMLANQIERDLRA